MPRVVGVHGIGKQLPGESTLLKEWQPAMADGLRRAGGGDAVSGPDVAMAFHGDLFRPAGQLLRVGDQSLAEHLREGIDPRAVHAAFTAVLTDRVPYRADTTRDWSRAHPYTLNHLAPHAAAAGRLDETLTDTEYVRELAGQAAGGDRRERRDVAVVGSALR